MARTQRVDRILLWEAIALVCVSLVMVSSASAVIDKDDGQVYDIMLGLLPHAVLGITALFVMMRIDYHELRRPQVIWTLLAVTVLALVAVYFFTPVKGATRWIMIGGFRAQPSELAKVAAIIFAAAVLERRMHRVNDFKNTLVPILGVAGILALLIVNQPDLGTAVMLVAAVFVMLLAAGLSWRFVAGSLLLLLPLLAFYIATHQYRVERISVFWNQSADPLNKGYQLNQSKIALGSGGLLGQGLGNSVQKRLFLPEPDNDFIFSVIGEEFGLVGTTLILLAFAVLAWRGLRAALLAPDRFGTLLGIGFVTMICFQAFLNMSVVTGLAPTKGIPLPLISKGGSSLLMNLIAVGILLNISQQASAKAAAAVEAR